MTTSNMIMQVLNIWIYFFLSFFFMYKKRIIIVLNDMLLTLPLIALTLLLYPVLFWIFFRTSDQTVGRMTNLYEPVICSWDIFLFWSQSGFNIFFAYADTQMTIVPYSVTHRSILTFCPHQSFVKIFRWWELRAFMYTCKINLVSEWCTRIYQVSVSISEFIHGQHSHCKLHFLFVSRRDCTVAILILNSPTLLTKPVWLIFNCSFIFTCFYARRKQ